MTESAKYDFAVIGTGPAGKRAALEAAKSGQRVVAIDLEQYLGGQAAHRGTIPSKTLREAVLHVTGIAQRSFYGNSYRVIADVTMNDLMQRTAQVIQAEVDVVRNAFLRNDVDLIFGTASFLQPNRLEVVSTNSSIEIHADQIIVATGSRPARPDHIPFDNPSVVDSDGILTVASIPGYLTIVGGGVIGEE